MPSVRLWDEASELLNHSTHFGGDFLHWAAKSEKFYGLARSELNSSSTLGPIAKFSSQLQFFSAITSLTIFFDSDP